MQAAAVFYDSECVRNAPFMLMQCPESCGVCARVARPTFRERHACAGLAKKGMCGDEARKSFMFTECPVSCQVVDAPCKKQQAPKPRRGGHDET